MMQYAQAAPPSWRGGHGQGPDVSDVSPADAAQGAVAAAEAVGSRAWRAAFALGALLAVVGASACLDHVFGRHDAYFVNDGLVDATVEVDGQTLTLAPGATRLAEVHQRVHHVTARFADGETSEFDTDGAGEGLRAYALSGKGCAAVVDVSGAYRMRPFARPFFVDAERRGTHAIGIDAPDAIYLPPGQLPRSVDIGDLEKTRVLWVTPVACEILDDPAKKEDWERSLHVP